MLDSLHFRKTKPLHFRKTKPGGLQGGNCESPLPPEGSAGSVHSLRVYSQRARDWGTCLTILLSALAHSVCVYVCVVLCVSVNVSV